jgi:large subunit GTPase 1
MGKQGHGIGKGKPKLKDRGFGNNLIRQQQIGAKGLNGLNYYADAEKRKTLLSNLESDDLSEYVEGLELADKEVDVHRVKSDATAAFLVEGTIAPSTVQTMNVSNFNYEHLPVPRKPDWDRRMTAEEVDKNERDAFLNWRRDIATMEEANAGIMKTTPFEKNLEVWRQLWRVLEKSDFGLQIIDARNPLLYYTEDLMKYAVNMECPMMLLVNKADFLTEYQRKAWAREFESMGIQFAFYSAANAQSAIDIEAKLSPRPSSALDEDEEKELAKAEATLVACDDGEVDMLADDIVENWFLKRRNVRLAKAKAAADALKNKGKEKEWGFFQAEVEAEKNAEKEETKERLLEDAEVTRRRCRILTRTELVLLLQEIPKKLTLTAQRRHNGRICVGMMGFPNVGKSSCINSILGVSKSTHGVTRVAVSSTPGKTKHFQTLIVNEEIMLCDCPGLVFPSFMRSTGEMLCAGILPVNQMRDYADPAHVITTRVPMHLLEAAYGCVIQRDLDIKDNPNRPPTGSEMLCAYCATKGYITSGTGRWDEFRACKDIIKDFCDGLLLFVSPPASVRNPTKTVNSSGVVIETEFDVNRWLQDTENVMMRRERIADRIATQKIKEVEEIEREAKAQAIQSSDKQNNASAHATGAAATDGTEMVFGDGSWSMPIKASPIPTVFVEVTGGTYDKPAPAPLKQTTDDGFVYDDESSDEEGGDAQELTPQGLPKREHKRQKSWGKKGRKLRDKNPYGEENGRVSMVGVGTTSRAKSGYSTTPLASKVVSETKRTSKRETFTAPNHC